MVRKTSAGAILVSVVAAAMSLLASTAVAQSISDSTGLSTGSIGYTNVPYSTTWDRIENKPATATRWPSWSEVTGKPQTATRWPKWSEVTGKPSTFTPSSHNHDGRYVRKGASGSINGNLTVSGTLTANRLVTGDVGGDRWCRANTSGRIQCTHDAPGGTKNVIRGWPVALYCDTKRVYYLENLQSDGSANYRTLVDNKSQIFFHSDGSYHKRNGDKPNSQCLRHIDDIPNNRKFL